MGFLDDIFGREKSDAPVSLMTPAQQQTQEALLTQATPLSQQYLTRLGEGYQGSLQTPYEQQGLQTLGDYLNQPLPTSSPVYQGAVSELEKTFGGEYDPVGGEYYQAYRTAVLRELQDAKDRLAANTSARDAYFGGGRIEGESRLEEGAMGQLAQVLGQLFENERTRRLGAVPVAQGLLQYGEQAPVGRVEAAQQLGGLSQDPEYRRYIMQMQELGIPLEVALNLATTKNEYYQPGYEPSMYERIFAPMDQAAATLAGAYLGGR